MSVVGGSGNCIQVSASDVVPAEQEVVFECTKSQSGPFKLDVAAPPSGWFYRYQIGTNSSGWLNVASLTEASGSIASATVALKPSASVLPGSTVSLSVALRRPNDTFQYQVTLGATRNMDGANFQLACDPATVSVATGATGTSNCAVSATNIAPGAQVAVSSIGVSMNPATGWTVSPTPTSGSLTGATSFPFTISLSPVCGAAVSPPAPNVQISSSLSFMGSGFAGPGGSITAAHNATATTVNAWITGASMDWTKTYSLGPQLDGGSLSYQVEATDGCAGWNVQLAATDFVYSGSANGSNIPAANFAVTGSGAPTGASLTGVGRPTTSGTLNSSLKLLNATEGNGLGTYDHAVDLGITIPGGARVGTYTSTVTITAASGP
jgi:hypothetical protein